MATDVTLVKSALRALHEENELQLNTVRNNHVRQMNLGRIGG